MTEFWDWITQLSNSKQVALILFFSLYLAIIIYVFTGKRRGERLESQKYIPFLDQDPEPRARSPEESSSRSNESAP